MVIVGVAPLTAKLKPYDVPPPGPAFETVNWSEVGFANSAAVNVTLIFVELTNVADLAAPLILTTEPAINPEPLRVTTVCALPAVTFEGDRLDKTGVGLITDIAVLAEDVPPPGAGFETVICGTPLVW